MRVDSFGGPNDWYWYGMDSLATVGEAYFVSITYDSETNSVSSYINGELTDIDTLGSYQRGILYDSLCIASRGYCSSGFFGGMIDEVRFYTRVLESNEIKILAELTPIPEIQYLSPAGDFSTLVKNADLTYTRTLKDGTKINFNAEGLETSVVDRNGNTTSYVYNADSTLSKITDPEGLKTTLTYTNGLLSRVTDPESRVTYFEHDSADNLTKITSAQGLAEESTTSFTYDADCNLKTTTDPLGNKTTREYDSYGNVKKTTDAEGKITQFTYNSLNRLTKVVDADSKTTSCTYDSTGNLLTAARRGIPPAKNHFVRMNFRCYTLSWRH